MEKSSPSPERVVAVDRTHAEEIFLTTGDMARLSKNTLRTVRFYEEEGILRPTKRTEGGHRLFEETELERLKFVSDLRMLGLPLDEIKTILDLKRCGANGADAARAAKSAIETRIRELEDKLAVLSRLRADLTAMASVVTECLDCKSNSCFPDACDSCSVIEQHVDLPRSMRVLWSVTGKTLKESSPKGEGP